MSVCIGLRLQGSEAMKLAFPLATMGMLALLISPALGQAAVTTVNSRSREAGKVEIVSGGAIQSDLHLNWLRDFGNFEHDHSAIAFDLSRNPFLVRSGEFRTEHPEWAIFLKNHPALCADIEANPGNYLVVTPHQVYASEHGRQSTHMRRSATKTKA
jgi:hypothetical protein